MLDAHGVTVRFGGLVAVDAVSMRVARGEIRGLIGPNGAGKTSFFNAIMGLVPTAQGTVVFDGQDVSRFQPYKRARLGMRRTFQAVQLVPQFTVLENVLVGLHDRIQDSTVVSVLGLPGAYRREHEAQDKAVSVLEWLGIADTLLRHPAELSFAQQRYVEIARAVVSDPPFLMLDEPAAGLSPADIERLDITLRRLRDELGMTILLVEHVLSLVLGISDRVTVLDNGRLISEGTADQVQSDGAVHAAYFGTDDA